jgi:hypothetical protein
MKTDDVIVHLQIINIWASFALEHTEFCFTDAMLKSIDVWTQEIVKWLKERQHDN